VSSRTAGYVGGNGIRYGGPAWQPAPTRKFSTCFAVALRRIPLHVSKSVTAGGNGVPPVRGHFQNCLPFR